VCVLCVFVPILGLGLCTTIFSTSSNPGLELGFGNQSLERRFRFLLPLSLLSPLPTSYASLSSLPPPWPASTRPPSPSYRKPPSPLSSLARRKSSPPSNTAWPRPSASPPPSSTLSRPSPSSTPFTMVSHPTLSCVVDWLLHNAGPLPCAIAPPITTGIDGFAECLKHSTKPEKHSAKALPSVALDKEDSTHSSSAKPSLPSTFSRALDKDVVEC
jgi:hypothetical protein